MSRQEAENRLSPEPRGTYLIRCVFFRDFSGCFWLVRKAREDAINQCVRKKIQNYYDAYIILEKRNAYSCINYERICYNLKNLQFQNLLNYVLSKLFEQVYQLVFGKSYMLI